MTRTNDETLTAIAISALVLTVRYCLVKALLHWYAIKRDAECAVTEAAEQGQ